jgi:hypothetical protein
MGEDQTTVQMKRGVAAGGLKATGKEDSMKLRLLMVVLGILTGVLPARAQYLYLDANGDGLNSDLEAALGNIVPTDLLWAAYVEAVDVYLVTDKMADGTPATCTSGEPFTIGSYQVVLRYVGSGSVTVSGWTDAMGFDGPNISAGDGTLAVAGPDIWIGRAGASHKAPGSYKLGTLHVTITGFPILVFASSSGIDAAAETAFASECDGARSDGLLRLGPVGDSSFDFVQSFGTTYWDAVVNTTWGKIKERYR